MSIFYLIWPLRHPPVCSGGGVCRIYTGSLKTHLNIIPSHVNLLYSYMNWADHWLSSDEIGGIRCNNRLTRGTCLLSSFIIRMHHSLFACVSWFQTTDTCRYRNKHTIEHTGAHTSSDTLNLDMLTGCVFSVPPVFQWAAEELTVNERPSPCPRGCMGCRRNGIRRGTTRSWWTSCCPLGSSSNSLCLETTPSKPSKKCVPSCCHVFIISCL